MLEEDAQQGRRVQQALECAVQEARISSVDQPAAALGVWRPCHVDRLRVELFCGRGGGLRLLGGLAGAGLACRLRGGLRGRARVCGLERETIGSALLQYGRHGLLGLTFEPFSPLAGAASGAALIGWYLPSPGDIVPVEEPFTNSMAGGRSALNAWRSFAGRYWVPMSESVNAEVDWSGAASILDLGAAATPGSGQRKRRRGRRDGEKGKVALAVGGVQGQKRRTGRRQLSRCNSHFGPTGANGHLPAPWPACPPPTQVPGCLLHAQEYGK